MIRIERLIFEKHTNEERSSTNLLICKKWLIIFTKACLSNYLQCFFGFPKIYLIGFYPFILYSKSYITARTTSALFISSKSAPFLIFNYRPGLGLIFKVGLGLGFSFCIYCEWICFFLLIHLEGVHILKNKTN